MPKWGDNLPLFDPLTGLGRGNLSIAKYKVSLDQLIPTDQPARIETDTKITDPGSNFLVVDWYGTSTIWAQANSSGNLSTNIQKLPGDPNFTGLITYNAVGQNAITATKVSWASNPDGTGTTGWGYITSLPDVSNLTIIKMAGADMANNYYYYIRKIGYLTPVAGFYLICASYRIAATEANKRYSQNTFSIRPDLTLTNCLNAIWNSVNADVNISIYTSIVHLNAGELVSNSLKPYSLAGNLTIAQANSQSYLAIMCIAPD